jgi:hypothetical protein
MYVLLKEPPPATKPPASVDQVDGKNSKFWSSVFCLEILVPILSVFTLNVSFQLLDTGLAPAANDALGFGPVAISTVFGLNSLLIFGAIIAVFILAAKGVTDEILLLTGLCFSIIGYTSMYFLWEADTTIGQFVLPILLSTMAFPFMASPTRSIFTKIVDSKEYLMYHQGTMQAILSMAASVAGFTAPGLIAGFILRTPEEVAASQDQREFTHYALFAPALSVITLVGVMYLIVSQKDVLAVKPKEEEVQAAKEEDYLLASEKRPSRRASEPGFNFHPKTEAERRSSTMIMGIPQIIHQPATVLEEGELGLVASDF